MAIASSPDLGGGFDLLFDAISTGEPQRLLFGKVRLPEGLIVDASAYADRDERGVRRTVTVCEFSPDRQIHNVLRASVVGNVMLLHGSVGIDVVSITAEIAQEVSARDLNLAEVSVPADRVGLLRRMSDIAVQLRA